MTLLFIVEAKNASIASIIGARFGDHLGHRRLCPLIL